jgi:hypothetical protein
MSAQDASPARERATNEQVCLMSFKTVGHLRHPLAKNFVAAIDRYCVRLPPPAER